MTATLRRRVGRVEAAAAQADWKLGILAAVPGCYREQARRVLGTMGPRATEDEAINAVSDAFPKSASDEVFESIMRARRPEMVAAAKAMSDEELLAALQAAGRLGEPRIETFDEWVTRWHEEHKDDHPGYWADGSIKRQVQNADGTPKWPFRRPPGWVEPKMDGGSQETV